jgi:tetratricopeptide (TPR) repeat protein
MKGRWAAIVMAAVLVLYLVLVMQTSFRLLAVDEPVAKALGIALIVLPLLGCWALWAELRFGIRSQQLAQALQSEGGLPADDLPKRASGRPDRVAADARFPHFQAAVEADPGNWMAWFRLGMAYDASGDRRRARQSIRRAIELEQASRRRPA